MPADQRANLRRGNHDRSSRSEGIFILCKVANFSWKTVKTIINMREQLAGTQFLTARLTARPMNVPSSPRHNRSCASTVCSRRRPISPCRLTFVSRHVSTRMAAVWPLRPSAATPIAPSSHSVSRHRLAGEGADSDASITANNAGTGWHQAGRIHARLDTGAGGFIGRTLTSALLQAGALTNTAGTSETIEELLLRHICRQHRTCV